MATVLHEYGWHEPLPVGKVLRVEKDVREFAKKLDMLSGIIGVEKVLVDALWECIVVEATSHDIEEPVIARVKVLCNKFRWHLPPKFCLELIPRTGIGNYRIEHDSSQPYSPPEQVLVPDDTDALKYRVQRKLKEKYQGLKPEKEEFIPCGTIALRNTVFEVVGAVKTRDDVRGRTIWEIRMALNGELLTLELPVSDQLMEATRGASQDMFKQEVARLLAEILAVRILEKLDGPSRKTVDKLHL